MEIDLNHAVIEVEKNACGNGDCDKGGGGWGGGCCLSSSTSLCSSNSSSSLASSSIYMELWHACAGPLSTLPKKGNVVVYFPQVSSPAIAREMLKDHDTTFANRDVSVAAKQSAYGGGDVAWSHCGSEWRMLRKLAVRGMLSNTRLDSVYSLRAGRSGEQSGICSETGSDFR
ncbi:Cytochrome P450 84A4 [Camellia lanceoleosa]|uniref:Cytochrome P450 84A4 n=1 Tax=Camellia lanceoleosa TaxID=1840588 RepID=A0ACC0GMU6_9ERIC|nr:Cytochrome P450 84A4 [Camellia lanceoleosa]